MRWFLLVAAVGCGGSRAAPPPPPAPPDARPEPVAESPWSCPAPSAGRGVVLGVVVDERSGAGQAGVIVRLAQTRVKTTAQGTFHLCDVPEGQHAIGFTYGGVEVERPVQVTAGQEVDVKLSIQAVGGPPVKLQ